MTGVIFMCLFFSTVFGFGMGTFNFYLQQSVNAATVQIANILYKLKKIGKMWRELRSAR